MLARPSKLPSNSKCALVPSRKVWGATPATSGDKRGATARKYGQQSSSGQSRTGKPLASETPPQWCGRTVCLMTPLVTTPTGGAKASRAPEYRRVDTDSTGSGPPPLGQACPRPQNAKSSEQRSNRFCAERGKSSAATSKRSPWRGIIRRDGHHTPYLHSGA